MKLIAKRLLWAQLSVRCLAPTKILGR